MLRDVQTSPATALVSTELACAVFSLRVDVRALPCDRVRYGAVARRTTPTRACRAEPGPCGPLVLEVLADREGTRVSVRGPADTPREAAASALEAAIAWGGLRDGPSLLTDVVADHPLLRDTLRRTGPVRLSRTPRVGEAIGRAVIAQLVQAVEAHRSIAQLASRVGTAAPGGLHAWPTARQIGSTPVWELRRCGVSGRAVRALHAAAVDDARLESCRDDFVALDRRLRAIPGIGVWTSGEVRRDLGDPDAVPVGDYNLPSLVGWVLAGDRDADDQRMLELLAPFAGQRARVIALVGRAVATGLAQRPRRRAPRAALSAHRYW